MLFYIALQIFIIDWIASEIIKLVDFIMLDMESLPDLLIRVLDLRFFQQKIF